MNSTEKTPLTAEVIKAMESNALEKRIWERLASVPVEDFKRYAEDGWLWGEFLEALRDISKYALASPQKEEGLTFKIRDWEMAKRRIGYLNYQGTIGVEQLVSIIAQLEDKIGYTPPEQKPSVVEEIYNSLSPEDKETFDKQKIVQSSFPSPLTEQKIREDFEEDACYFLRKYNPDMAGSVINRDIEKAMAAFAQHLSSHPTGNKND